MHEVPDHVQVADHSPANPASEAHDLAIPVPDGADAVQGALNSCPVVASKGAHSRLSGMEVSLGDLLSMQNMVRTSLVLAVMPSLLSGAVD